MPSTRTTHTGVTHSGYMSTRSAQPLRWPAAVLVLRQAAAKHSKSPTG